MKSEKPIGSLGPIACSILDYLAAHPKSANKPIAQDAGVSCKACFHTIRHLLDSGRIVHHGAAGKRTYSLAPGVKSPTVLYKQQTEIVLSTLKCRPRIGCPEASKILGLTICATRRLFTRLVEDGHLYLSLGSGYFLNEDTFIQWKANRSRSKRTGRKIVRFEAANLNPLPTDPGDNTIFEECRQLWEGYQVHKIFGSARA